MATLWFLLFWVALGLGVFAVAMRGGRRRRPLTDTRGGRRLVFASTAAAILLFGVAIPVIGIVVGDDGVAEGPAGLRLTAFEQHGRELFVENCAQCHALDAAAAVGKVGPNLDQMRPPKALVLDAIEQGRARGMGQMPADLLQGQDARAVAEFVATAAGR